MYSAATMISAGLTASFMATACSDFMGMEMLDACGGVWEGLDEGCVIPGVCCDGCLCDSRLLILWFERLRIRSSIPSRDTEVSYMPRSFTRLFTVFRDIRQLQHQNQQPFYLLPTTVHQLLPHSIASYIPRKTVYQNLLHRNLFEARCTAFHILA